MNKKSSFGVTLASIFSATLGFLGIITCCGMPIVAGILSFLGIGASLLAIKFHLYSKGNGLRI